MREQKGFTLIELLVVIAVIALLLSILVPSLGMAKRKASMTADLNSVKNIALAWFMYKEENGGRICSSDPGSNDAWVKHPRNTAGATLSATDYTPVVTDDDEKRGIEAGVLFPYIKSSDTFHCPMDNRKSCRDGSKIFRTYSMPAYLNYAGTTSADKQFNRYEEIRSPGTKIMLVEEAEVRNYNYGAWSFGAPEWTGGPLMWWDPLAVTHGDSSTLGFCDGHSDNHKWVDKFTKERPNKLAITGGTSYGTEAPPANQVTDIQYIYSCWGYRKK